MYFIKKIKSFFHEYFCIHTKSLSGRIKGFHSGHDVFVIEGDDGKIYYYEKRLIKKDQTNILVACLLNTGVELNFLVTQDNKFVSNLSFNEDKYQILNAKFDYAMFKESEGNYDAGLISNIDGKEVFLKFNLHHRTPIGRYIHDMKHGDAIIALFDKEDEKLISVRL